MIKLKLYPFILATSLLLILVWTQSDSVAQDANTQEKVQSKKFDKKGLTFDYPDQWKIGSDESFSGTRLVIVYGPNNAIVTIQFSEIKFADSLEDYVKEYSETAAAEVKKVAKLTNESLTKKSKNKFDFESITEKFTLENGETKIPHDRIYLRKKIDKYACFIVCQTSTANMEKVESGFRQLITTIELRTKSRKSGKTDKR